MSSRFFVQLLSLGGDTCSVLGVAVALAGVVEAVDRLRARPQQRLGLINGPVLESFGCAGQHHQVGEPYLALLQGCHRERKAVQLAADRDPVADHAFAHAEGDPQPVDRIEEAVLLMLAAGRHFGCQARPLQLLMVDVETPTAQLFELGSQRVLSERA